MPYEVTLVLAMKILLLQRMHGQLSTYSRQSACKLWVSPTINGSYLWQLIPLSGHSNPSGPFFFFFLRSEPISGDFTRLGHVRCPPPSPRWPLVGSGSGGVIDCGRIDPYDRACFSLLCLSHFSFFHFPFSFFHYLSEYSSNIRRAERPVDHLAICVGTTVIDLQFLPELR